MKKMMVMLLGLILAAGAYAESRTWTLKNGKTVDGEFKEMKLAGKTEVMTVFVTLEDGKPRGIPLTQLSEEDQAVAKQLAGE